MIDDLQSGNVSAGGSTGSKGGDSVQIVATEEYLEMQRAAKQAGIDQKKLASASQAISELFAQLKVYKQEAADAIVAKYADEATGVSDMVNEVTNQIGISKAVPPGDKDQSLEVIKAIKQQRANMFAATEAIKEAKVICLNGIKDAKKAQTKAIADGVNLD